MVLFCVCVVSGSRMLLPPVNGHTQFLNRSFDQLIKLTLILPPLSGSGRNEFMGAGSFFIKFRLTYHFGT